MLCQKCQKNNANVKIVKNYNGNVEEFYLCSACAAKEDLKFKENMYSSSLFDNLFNIFTPLGTNELMCTNCKTTYSEFKKKGKFGCTECFNAFENYLEPLFKNIHGSITHSGKLPKRSAEPIRMRRKADELKEKLNQAIKEENFEEAARIRDELREINKGGSL